MNKTHTPGPWKARISGNVANTVSTEDGIGIARVIGDEDAHLIAAAPQMLEALEEFCARVDAGEVRSKRTYAKFKELIKAAKGEV